MNGRLVGGGLIAAGLIAGAALYYLQVHHYYRDASDEVGAIRLTPAGGGTPVEIATEALRAIDAASSPIRFRACFRTPLDYATLTGTFEVYPAAEPLVAPGWFRCFDAGAIGAALDAGEALPFLSVKNVIYGVDRVVVFFPDGQGYAWHQINDCGEVVFDGEPVPPGCPPPPDRQ